MKKIKTESTHDLVIEYINTRAGMLLQFNSSRGYGIKGIQKRLNDIENELLERGFFTEEDIRNFNS